MDTTRSTSTFRSLPTPLSLLQGEEQCSSSGRLEFVAGGLRGGANSALHTLASSTSARRRQPQSAFELARTDSLERRFRIVKVEGDGRCLFRALAKGLVHNQGGHVAGIKETEAADELRLAVHDALCRSKKRSKDFEEVEYSVNNIEGGRASYCKRLQQDDFWGGELEVLVLSKMLHVPIFIYRTASEAGVGNFGFVPIAKYGEQWEGISKSGKSRQPVHLLYGNGNHYDVLF